MLLGDLVQDHDIGDLDCGNCDRQQGFCSCGGVIHCETQNLTILSGSTAMIMECDNCDEYELE